MKNFCVLEDNIDEKVKDVNLVYDENKDIREVFEELVTRYCFPPKGVEEFNKILGTTHEECFWKMKLIEVTNLKKGIKPAEKVRHTMEELINDVDDPQANKLFNTSSENLMRDETESHFRYMYLDILQGLYYTLKCKEEKDAFAEHFEKEQMFSLVMTEIIYDYIDDILYADRLTQDNINVDLKESISTVVETVRNCGSLYERLFLLYEAGILMWHRRAIKIEEREAYIEEALERMEQGADVVSDLLYTLQETYEIFSEMLYAVLYKKNEGDHSKITAILKEEIEKLKEELQITEEDGFDKLNISIYGKAPRTEENDLYKAVKAAVTEAE